MLNEFFFFLSDTYTLMFVDKETLRGLEDDIVTLCT